MQVDYYRREKSYFLPVVIIVMVILFLMGIYLIFASVSTPKRSVFSRCAKILPGSYSAYSLAYGSITLLGFDLVNKPCVFNPDREAWEPVSLSAPTPTPQPSN